MDNLLVLDQQIAEGSILRHPFYLAWTRGDLTKDQLATYAAAYYPHVAAFPGYLRNTLAWAEDDLTTETLQSNLKDELHHPAPHPKLWLDFAEAMGAGPATTTLVKQTAETIATFNRLTSRDLASGLTALYVYESQQPQVAREKARGLREFYGVKSRKALRYFTVHATADLEHRAGERAALAQCLETGASAATISHAAAEAIDAYWNLLDGVCEEANLNLAA